MFTTKDYRTRVCSFYEPSYRKAVVNYLIIYFIEVSEGDGQKR